MLRVNSITVHIKNANEQSNVIQVMASAIVSLFQIQDGSVWCFSVFSIIKQIFEQSRCKSASTPNKYDVANPLRQLNATQNEYMVHEYMVHPLITMFTL